MKRLLSQFKLPLIATGITLFVVTLLCIGLGVLAAQSGAANLEERAAKLGQGMGMLVAIILTPFWIYAGMQVGKERRNELKTAYAKTKSKSGPSRKKPKA